MGKKADKPNSTPKTAPWPTGWHDGTSFGYPPVTVCMKCGRILSFQGANDRETTGAVGKACDGGAP